VTTANRAPELQVHAHPTGDAPAVSAVERFVGLPAGRFRYLEWPGEGTPVVLLHGLSGVAEVWQPVVNRLPGRRPRLLAFDQRGHGDSHPVERSYDIGAYVSDTLAFFDALGLNRPHLAGHSMGARVAMVLAARHPESIRSVAMADIGPEQWKANWESTMDAFERMPKGFTSQDEAIAFASRGREMSDEARAVFLSRLRAAPDGSLAWRANADALAEAVRSHRSRNFWRDWERVRPPALLVRGGDSRELRPHVYQRMQSTNSACSFVEIPGVGHNLPLIAPKELAELFADFWRRVDEGGY
jgi:pimeloyl-ACP methyl ester carboxylesterase